LGKVAALFRLDPVNMYIVAQVVGGAAFFIATYIFISFLFPKKFQSIAFFFAFLIQVGSLLSDYLLARYLIPPYATIPLESSQLTIFRQFGLPHHTMGEAIGLLTLTALLSSFTNKMTIPKAGAIIIGSFIGVNVLTPYFITLILALLPSILLYAFSTKTVKKLIIPAGIFVISCAVAAVLLRTQLSLGPPWSTVYQVEKTWWTVPDLLTRYITSLYLYIPYILLAIITLPFIWKKTTEHIRLAFMVGIGWLFIPVIIMPITSLPIVPVASFRLIDGYQYVPAAILATCGIIGIHLIIKRPIIKVIIISVLLAMGGFVSYHLTSSYLGGILDEQYHIWSNVYPSNSFWEAVQFFHTVPKGSRVLATEHTGQLLADYAPIRSFVGKTPGFSDFLERRGIMGWFLQGIRTDEVARGILTREHIDYVYFGEDERRICLTDSLYPNVLIPVFTRPGVIVYAVKKP